MNDITKDSFIVSTIYRIRFESYFITKSSLNEAGVISTPNGHFIVGRNLKKILKINLNKLTNKNEVVLTYGTSIPKSLKLCGS